MGDFGTADQVRLTLHDGKFIDIRKRLNHGEREDMYERWSQYVVPGEKTQLKRSEVRTAKVAAYILGWSLTTDDGKPVPMSPQMPDAERTAMIRNLDPDRFDEIHTAIETHEDAMAAERAAAKNGQGGATASPAISPSPSAAGGVSATSVN